MYTVGRTTFGFTPPFPGSGRAQNGGRSAIGTGHACSSARDGRPFEPQVSIRPAIPAIKFDIPGMAATCRMGGVWEGGARPAVPFLRRHPEERPKGASRRMDARDGLAAIPRLRADRLFETLALRARTSG